MVRYDIDPTHTNIGFSAKHLGVATVRGRFDKFEGYFEGPAENPTEARGEIKIEVASMTTHTAQRDDHLRSADFFDAAKYPYVTYRITGIENVEADRYLVRGELTIKDVTKPVALEATLDGRGPDPFGAPGQERMGIVATGQINRMEFGLNWDGIAGAVPIASHNIKLNIEAEIVVKAAEPVDSNV